jgi:hypothetical protein
VEGLAVHNHPPPRAAAKSVTWLRTLSKNDHPGPALSDLTVTHDEHLSHGHAHLSARGAPRRAGELSYDDVVLLDHSHDVQRGSMNSGAPSMAFSNTYLPVIWNTPKTVYLMSSIRQDRICLWSFLRKPSR